MRVNYHTDPRTDSMYKSCLSYSSSSPWNPDFFNFFFNFLVLTWKGKMMGQKWSKLAGTIHCWYIFSHCSSVSQHKCIIGSHVSLTDGTIGGCSRRMYMDWGAGSTGAIPVLPSCLAELGQIFQTKRYVSKGDLGVGRGGARSSNLLWIH